MDIGVSVFVLESGQRVGPEHQQGAGEGASDGLDQRAGIGFATAERRDIGESDVAVRGEVEVLAETDTGLDFFGIGDQVGVGRGDDLEFGDFGDGRVERADACLGFIPSFPVAIRECAREKTGSS